MNHLGEDAEGHGDARPQEAELDGGDAVEVLVEPPGVEEGEEELPDLQRQVDLQVERGGPRVGVAAVLAVLGCNSIDI